VVIVHTESDQRDPHLHRHARHRCASRRDPELGDHQAPDQRSDQYARSPKDLQRFWPACPTLLRSKHRCRTRRRPLARVSKPFTRCARKAGFAPASNRPSRARRGHPRRG
jgi:hypothetical protein